MAFKNTYHFAHLKRLEILLIYNRLEILIGIIDERVPQFFFHYNKSKQLVLIWKKLRYLLIVDQVEYLESF